MVGGLPREVDQAKQKGGFQRTENARKRTAHSTGSMEAERPLPKRGKEIRDASAPPPKVEPDIQIAAEAVTNWKFHLPLGYARFARLSSAEAGSNAYRPL